MRMKRLTIVLVALLVAVAPGYCQTKREVNAARKEAAAAARNLKRGGFKSIELGDVQTRLEKYFLKVNSGCAEIVGIAENCMSMNLAQITALSNAANQYALLAGGDVRGRIIGSTNNLSDQQMDNIVSSFERIVEKNIRGELMPYITAVRERKDRYNVRAYCIVDIDSADVVLWRLPLRSSHWRRSTGRWFHHGLARASTGERIYEGSAYITDVPVLQHGRLFSGLGAGKG